MASDGFNGKHRDEWVQHLSPAAVKRACAKKRRFHEKRVSYWLRQRKSAEAKFKKAGMKLVPNLGLSTQAMYSATSNKREVATVDHKLLQDWENYNAKAEQHKAMVAELRKWEQFLGSASGSYRLRSKDPLRLSMQDCEFFGIVSEATPDQESE